MRDLLADLRWKRTLTSFQLIYLTKTDFGITWSSVIVIDLKLVSQRRNMMICQHEAAGRHAVAEHHHAAAEAAPAAAEGAMVRALERFVGMPSSEGSESMKVEARSSSSSSSSDIGANWKTQVSSRCVRMSQGHDPKSGFCCLRRWPAVWGSLDGFCEET